MYTDLTNIGWEPALAGTIVLIIGAISGWGIAATPTFPPVIVVRFWVDRVILPALRNRMWVFRTTVIFGNNATICALVILAGKLPSGAWVAVVLVGLAIGIAFRLLGESDVVNTPGDDSDAPPRADALVQIGLVLNLLEIPAIVITMGLSMGQLAKPNGLSSDSIWNIFAVWVMSLLLIAAAGESLWIGRQRFFR